MKQEETDEKYMRRCLQLARNGQQAEPNGWGSHCEQGG